MQIFLERLFDGITNGSIYALMALALVVVFRSTATINFAQGEMALFSTYVAWWLTSHGVSVWVGLLVATGVGLALGAGTERALIRPVRRRNDMAALIVALGLFTALNALDGVLWNSDTKVMPSLFPNGLGDYVSVGGARLYWDALGVWIATGALLLGLYALFNHTRLGLHMRAVASNPESAALSGVPTGRILMVGWGLSGAIGAVAGVLVTPLAAQQLSLETMFPILIYASAAALLGGLDSLAGAVIGGLAIGLLEAMVTGYVSAIGDSLPQTAALGIIVVILLARPTGLLGSRRLERV